MTIRASLCAPTRSFWRYQRLIAVSAFHRFTDFIRIHVIQAPAFRVTDGDIGGVGERSHRVDKGFDAGEIALSTASTSSGIAEICIA
jgi:hypothetical protein